MQTLWSRAAQARHSCRCPTCLPRPNNALSGQRSVNVSRKIERPVFRLPTSATFTYSAILFAAAAIDADIKTQRSEQWTASIAHEKRRTEEASDSLERMTKAMEDQRQRATQLGQMRPEPSTPASISGSSASSVTSSDAFDESREVIEGSGLPRWQTHNADGKLHWPTSIEPRFFPSKLAANSIYSDPQRRYRAMEKSWSPKKTRLTELAILRAVYYICLHDPKLHGLTRQQSTSIPDPIKEISQRRAPELYRIFKNCRRSLQEHMALGAEHSQHEDRRSIPGMPCYHKTREAEFMEEATKMHASLRKLFRQYKDDEIDQSTLLSSICSELLNSRAPPVVTTFNILFGSLCELGLDVAMRAFIRAALECYSRLNETSCRWILHYYTISNQRTRFFKFITLMLGGRALDQTGLMLAGPSLLPDFISYPTDHWTSQGSASLTVFNPESGRKGPDIFLPHPKDPQKIIERSYPTLFVLRTLVRGLTTFESLDDALRIYAGLRDVGWPLSVEALLPFLEKARDDRNLDVGMSIWAAMCSTHRTLLQDHLDAGYSGRKQILWMRRAHKIMHNDAKLALRQLCEECGLSEADNGLIEEPVTGREMETTTRLTLSSSDGLEPAPAEEASRSTTVTLAERPDLASTQPTSPPPTHDTTTTTTTRTTTTTLISIASPPVDDDRDRVRAAHLSRRLGMYEVETRTGSHRVKLWSPSPSAAQSRNKKTTNTTTTTTTTTNNASSRPEARRASRSIALT